MKQAEKSKATYNKILAAAINEFGTKNYDNASVNNICNDNNISKGLIYHNFKNKDELYLCTVKLCFDALTDYLSGFEYTSADFSENIKKLLDLRYQFFCDNPYYSNIFFNTVLQPPKHLIKQINTLRCKFDEFNSNQYKTMLKNVELRDNITKEEALEYFLVLGEMFNSYFQGKAYEISNYHCLIEDHETKLSKFLNIMLCGITKEKTK